MVIKVVRSLDFNENDYKWVNPVIKHPQPKPEPQSFDLGLCTKKLRKALQHTSDRYGKNTAKGYCTFNWADADLPIFMTPTEAHFWFFAMTMEISGVSRFDFPLTTRNVDDLVFRLFQLFTPYQQEDLSLEKIISVLFSIDKGLQKEIVLSLFNLFPICQILEKLNNLYFFDNTLKAKRVLAVDYIFLILQGCQDYYWEYFTQKEKNNLTKIIRPHLIKTLDILYFYNDIRFYERIKLFLNLAIKLGMDEDIQKLVEDWQIEMFTEDFLIDCFYYERFEPQQVILSLKSSQEVEKQMRRLQLPLITINHIKSWLTKTQYSALDYIRDSIIQLSEEKKQKRKDNTLTLIDLIRNNIFARLGNKSAKKTIIASQLISAFGLAKAPEVAPYMLELAVSSPGGKIAKNWLRQNPEHTIPGLIPVAMEGGEFAKAAIEILQYLRLKGHEELITAWLGEQPEAAADKLQAKILDRPV